MWQRGTLGTYVWKHAICTGQCYHWTGEYVQEGTCIPRADKIVQTTSFIIGNSGKWNCVPYVKILLHDRYAQRHHEQLMEARGDCVLPCRTAARCTEYQPPTFRFAVDMPCPFTRPSVTIIQDSTGEVRRCNVKELAEHTENAGATPWSKVLLEKLTGLQLVRKSPTF
jgi:hypothetical protein